MTTTKFLTLTDGRIAYTDEGTGPLVVCVPAMIGLKEEYRFLTPLLVAAGHRVVTIDIRGMGESSADWPEYGSAPIGRDVLALLRHLDAGPALLVGASSGAAASVVAAAEAPELVSGLALLGAFVRDGKSLALTITRAVAAIPGLAVPLWKTHVGQMYAGAKPADFAEYRARLAANLAEPGRAKAAKGYICHMRHTESGARITEVHQPTVVVMGTLDPDFPDPAAEGRWIADTLQGTLVLAENAGHHPHAQTPEAVAAAIATLPRA